MRNIKIKILGETGTIKLEKICGGCKYFCQHENENIGMCTNSKLGGFVSSFSSCELFKKGVLVNAGFGLFVESDD